MTDIIDKKRILVVEDNDDVRNIVTIYLKSKGFLIYEAVDGEEGVAKAEELKPDLLLSDVLLPKLDGIDALKKIRATENGAAIPVVMMSAVLKTRDIQSEAANLNISAFLEKPFQVRSLLETIESVLRQNSTANTTAHSVPPNTTVRRRQTITVGAASLAPDEVANAESPAQNQTVTDSTFPSRGKLENYPLPEIIHSIFSHKQTGRLRLISGSDEKRIYFIKGSPVYAESSIPGETLGAYLVKQKIITMEQHKATVKQMTQKNTHYGEALLSLNILEPNELFLKIELHLREKIIATFAWFTGHFLFEEGNSWKDDIIVAQMPPGRLIIDGISQNWSKERILALKTFPDSSLLAENSNLQYSNKDLTLSANEAKILHAVRNNTSFATIQKLFSNFDGTIHFLFSLYVMNIISVSKGNVSQDSSLDKGTNISANSHETHTSRQNNIKEQAILSEYLKLRTSDYFTFLGISQTASEKEINDAIIKAQQKYHPKSVAEINNDLVIDKVAEMYTRVNKAAEILSDSEKKQQYIRQINEPVSSMLSPRSKTSQYAPIKIKTTHSQDFEKGLICLRDANYKEALNCFTSAYKQEEKLKYHIYMIWTVFLTNPKKEKEKTEHEFKSLQKKHDDETLLPYLLGNLYLRSKQKKEARRAFEKAIQIDPQNIDAARQLRILNMRKNNESSGLFEILSKKR